MATHVKLSVTHYRKPELTHEAFMKWITEEHIPLAMPGFKRCGVVNYSIFETPSDMNTELKVAMGGHRAAWDYADFDCFIEYAFKDREAIGQLLTDPDFNKSIEHQEDWVDTSRALMSIGSMPAGSSYRRNTIAVPVTQLNDAFDGELKARNNKLGQVDAILDMDEDDATIESLRAAP
ncbi:hypothetical protein F4808DRAFT_454660 [Astrocystis sublimbata]|nr:hypothetical protein F4808DRAFT_454660 [Astrocystis sublimbata]